MAATQASDECQWVAVLSKKHLAERPYDRWLGRLGRRVVLFASTEDEAVGRLQLKASEYQDIFRFDSWRDDPQVPLAVAREHRKRPFQHLVALSESDLRRASELRQDLGLAGQDPESARAFRNKYVMKRLARAAGLPVPQFTAVFDCASARRFAAGVSGALVVKPMDGSGSRGVCLLRDDADLSTWLSSARPQRGSRPRFLLEERVPAPMLSVDGIMAAGQLIAATVSTYSRDCLSSLSTLSPHGLLQLPESDPRDRRARAFVRRLLVALPCPQETTSFHCELFAPPDGDMMLCEIASRTGGGRINSMARRSLGIDLDRWTSLGQAGLDPLGDSQPPRRSAELFGDLLFPNPGGVLRSAPDSCPIAEVVDYEVRPRVGESVPPARKVSEYAIDVLYRGADRPALEHTHQRVLDWIEATVHWD